MKTPNNETTIKKNKKLIIWGSAFLLCTLICVMMTVIFIYATNSANQQVEGIRDYYRETANRRDEKVEGLATQVDNLQKKIDQLPENTATKTADKVKKAVKEDEDK